MARIIIPGTRGGASLLALTNEIIYAKNHIDRLKAMADQTTNAGASPALLEASTEWSIPAGQGAAIYNGLGQIQTALQGLATLLAAIDQSA